MDHRADIYSLGVVFYQMLTGELPGKPIEPPSQKVQVDVRLDEVVLRALEKEPERRYQQVSEVKTAVETISIGHHRQVHRRASQPAATHVKSPTPAPSPRLLNVDASFVTTPEQLGTFDGQFFLLSPSEPDCSSTTANSPSHAPGRPPSFRWPPFVTSASAITRG